MGVDGEEGAIVRITRVSYKNLKGRTEDVDLGSATLIHGPNFSGKTTIVDAVKLALLGHMPGLDKTAQGVMQLASGDSLSVSATVVEENKKPSGHTERVIGREWTRDARGKVSRRDFVPMGWPEVPVVLLDAGAYFGASDRGKAELLFAAANIKTAITVGDISKALTAFGVWMSDPYPMPGENVQTFVERALSVAEQARSGATASARRYADTMQGLSALATADPVPIDEDALELRAKKAGQLADALEALHRLERERDDGGSVDPKLDDAVRRVKTLKAFIAQKEVEIGKCIQRWDKLLSHDDCPMCGTKGESWRTKALANRKAEMARLESEKLELRREANSRMDFVGAEETRVKAELAKAGKAQKRKLDKAEEAVADLREELEDAEKKARASIDDQADRKRLAEARAKHKEYADLEKNMKEVKAYLLQLKGKMASNLFEPILKVAGAFTDGILPWKLAFVNGQLGMRQTTLEGDQYSWIPHSTFSGTEQAIAFAGFQAALGATAPIRLVVMDELGRIDEANKTKLLMNVCMALENGVIDQFVGIDTVVPSGIKGGWAQGPHEQKFTLVERGGKKKK